MDRSHTSQIYYVGAGLRPAPTGKQQNPTFSGSHALRGNEMNNLSGLCEVQLGYKTLSRTHDAQITRHHAVVVQQGLAFAFHTDATCLQHISAVAQLQRQRSVLFHH